MVCLRCTRWARGIRRYSRVLGGRIYVPSRKAESSVFPGLRHPHSLLVDGRASGTYVFRISAEFRKVDRSEVRQTNTADSSGLPCRRCNAFRPKMGISDSQRRQGGTDAQLGDVHKPCPECKDAGIGEAVCRTGGNMVSMMCKWHGLVSEGVVRTG